MSIVEFIEISMNNYLFEDLYRIVFIIVNRFICCINIFSKFDITSFLYIEVGVVF